MGITEIGDVCKHFKTVEDFKANQAGVCLEEKKCLMCKCFKDTQEMEAYIKSEHYEGMKRFIE
eukprot:104716-Heterocapsa_arctica.AAC.1